MRAELDAGAQVHAVGAVQVGEAGGDLVAEHGVQGLGRHLQDDDLDAVLAGGAGDLETDPAAADDAEPRALGQGGAQPLGVVPLAQVVHLGAAVVGEREVPGPGAGGQHEGGVRRLVAGRGDTCGGPGRSR